MDGDGVGRGYPLGAAAYSDSNRSQGMVIVPPSGVMNTAASGMARCLHSADAASRLTCQAGITRCASPPKDVTRATRRTAATATAGQRDGFGARRRESTRTIAALAMSSAGIIA